MWAIQKTLVVFKPDTIARSLVGEVLSRFERAGLQLVAMKMIKPDSEFLHGHYEWIWKLWTRRGQDILDKVIQDMMKVPLIAMVVKWVDAVEYVRKIVGATEPKSALPGTIRWDFAHMSYAYADNAPSASVYNLVHASADSNEAEQEIKHWFDESEIFDYDPLNLDYTR